jgi:hypothetical protein
MEFDEVVKKWIQGKTVNGDSTAEGGLGPVVVFSMLEFNMFMEELKLSTELTKNPADEKTL